LQAVFAGVDRGDRPYETPENAKTRTRLEHRKAEVAEHRDGLVKKAAAMTTPELARLDDELAALRREPALLPKSAPPVASPSNGYHSGIAPTPDVVKWVQVDLGRALPVDEVRLIPARPTDFPDTPGFGFPARLKVEVADDAAFARATTVLDRSNDDVANPGDNPAIVRPRPRSARYVRVTATRLWRRTNDYVFALGELEVISDGVNVASRARVSALDSIEAGRWSRANLVDGFDSRASLPSLSDPRFAPLVRQRNELQYRIQESKARRKALAESLIEPSTRLGLEQSAAELEALGKQIKTLASADQVYAVTPHAPRPIHRLNRGDVEQPREPVGPGALSCVRGLTFDFSAQASQDEGNARAALADWIASPANVLTWRSIVNRVWHYHFGRGLVDTPNDFGRNGSRPTHPELLDWLAVEFLEHGQSLKALHRAIVRSAVYRQASGHDAASAAKDADNRWLWRMNRRRLDAESLRDAVLAASGTLDTRMGGPGFALFRFKDDHSPVYDHTAPEASDNSQVRRRTVYRFVVRSVPNPFLESLDCADPNINTPVRPTTITALQALALLNDVFMVRQSRAFADRLQALCDELGERIDAAYLLALGREPRPEEREAVAAYANHHGLANACRLLFNTSEFIFVD
jgi:hypothetical protein